MARHARVPNASSPNANSARLRLVAILVGVALPLLGCGAAGGAGQVGTQKPAAAGDMLYRANWSGGLDGWSGSQDWKSIGGELLSSGKEFRTTVGAVAPVDVSAAAGFAVEAEIQLLRYTDSFGKFGVMTRVQDDGGGYGFGPAKSGNVVVLRTERGSGEPMLDSQPFAPDAGWHKYRIEVNENVVRTFIDGAPALNATDNTFLSGRRVGLWSYGAQVSVRSFEVSAL